jgi:hypothetical protein
MPSSAASVWELSATGLPCDEGRDFQPECDHAVEEADARADHQPDERCNPDVQPIRRELSHHDTAEDEIDTDGEVKLTSDHEDSHTQRWDAHLNRNRVQRRLDVGETVIGKNVGADESVDHADDLDYQEDNEDVESRLLATITAPCCLCALYCCLVGSCLLEAHINPFLLSALVQKRWNNLAISAVSPGLGESLSSTTSMSLAGLCRKAANVSSGCPQLSVE